MSENAEGQATEASHALPRKSDLKPAKPRTWTKAERIIHQLDQEALRLEHAATALRQLSKLLAEQPEMAYPIAVAGKHLKPGWWEKL